MSLSPYEKVFYDSAYRAALLNAALAESSDAFPAFLQVDDQIIPNHPLRWSEEFEMVRQCAAHPAVSSHLQSRAEAMGLKKFGLLRNSMLDLLARYRTLTKNELGAAVRDLVVAKKVLMASENSVRIGRALVSRALQTVQECIYDQTLDIYQVLGSRGLTNAEFPFRCIGRHLFGEDEFRKHGYQDFRTPIEHVIFGRGEIVEYLKEHLNTEHERENFLRTMTTNLNTARKMVREIEYKQRSHQADMSAIQQVFDSSISCESTLKPLSSNANDDVDSLIENRADFEWNVNKYGSKIAHLVKYIKTVYRCKTLVSTINSAGAPEGCVSAGTRRPQLIVFTFWEDLIGIVADALIANEISYALFTNCSADQESGRAGSTKVSALDKFVRGEVDVLLLCSLSSASGINLQMASQVYPNIQSPYLLCILHIERNFSVGVSIDFVFSFPLITYKVVSSNY